MYDLVAGRKLLKPSYYLNKDKTTEEFPMIKRDGLCGAIVYYDGKWEFSYLYLLKLYWLMLCNQPSILIWREKWELSWHLSPEDKKDCNIKVIL